jgi:succinoglycan biosynthesis transport protein ExoP
MNFSQFLLMVQARRHIIVWTLLVTVILGLVVSLVMPKMYKATTTLVINYKGNDPVSGLMLQAQLMPGYMATQVDIISSESVALRVVDRLKMAEGEEIKQEFMAETKGEGDIRHWLADELLPKLDVLPSRESGVMEVSFKGKDPKFVADVANAFAAEYQIMGIQLQTEPLRRASTYFAEQIKLLRENYEGAQQKLSAYQQEKGIISQDDRIDTENERLNELSTELVNVQGQVMEALSRQRMAQGQSAESPDVAANPMIQNLKTVLAQAEGKFSEISQRLDVNHPQYQSAKAEVEKLRAELKDNLKVTSNSVGNNARILQQRQDELTVALAAQKAKVLDLNRSRDQLSVLQKELESAQHAYETTTQRFTQTNLEGQFNQSDVSVLNPAVPPVDPSRPKLKLNLMISVFLGTVLGFGICMLMEILDRRVRSPEDISAAIGVATLGEINWIKPNSDNSRVSKWWFLFGRGKLVRGKK